MVSLEKQIAKLPDSSGVYLFKRGREILYIGKATSLRSRVRSYFPSTSLGINRLIEARSEWIAKMIALVTKIDFIETDSVLEALILESAQIKKHQPAYNTREKDDKSFLYVGITREVFPRILTIRGSELKLLPPSSTPQAIFGPFPYGAELREALKIIRKIFPYRDSCKPPPTGGSGKLCFNAQIGLCPGVCGGLVSQADYARTIRHITLLFQGKKSRLIKTLEREMKARAKKLEFEKADELKRQIWRLRHIQDVAVIKKQVGSGEVGGSSFRIESYDIAHLSGTNSVGVMAVMENGELTKNEYRKFKLKGESAQKADDTGNLKEILERRFNHAEWSLPNLIVVDGSTAQLNAAKAVLAARHLTIPLVAVVKDDKHKAREILGDARLIKKYQTQIIQLNAAAHRFAIGYHRRLRSIR